MMKAGLLVVAATQLMSSASAFASSRHSHIQIPATRRIRDFSARSSSPDDNDNNESQEQQQDPVEAFMEEASRKGADKVKEMSIEERTKRAMLAEAVEDRVFQMYDDLEGLLKDGVPATEDDREEISNIAKQIKASQLQYENLVSGKPSEMLGTMDGLEENVRRNNDKSTEE